MVSFGCAHLVSCLAFLFCAHAMIEEPWEPGVKFPNDPNVLHFSPMFSREDSPAGEGNSTVSYNCEKNEGHGCHSNISDLQPGGGSLPRQPSSVHKDTLRNCSPFLFYLPDSRSQGSSVREYCCTDPAKEDCTLGEVIIKPHPHSLKNSFSKRLLPPPDLNANVSETEQTISEEFNVTQSGIYYFLVISCDYDNSKDALYIEGSCAWENPYGYLPGDVYMKFPMSGGFALIYVGLMITYLAFCIKYRSVLLKLQYVILFSIFLCVLEASAWYFYRLTNNTYGRYSTTSLFVVVLFGTTRKTFLHLLVLLISMGVGIVKWTIGTARVKLGLLTVFYLFFAFLLQFVIELDAVKKHSVISATVYRVLIVIPMAILSVCFYYWILLSLIRTIQQLTLRRQVLKLQMYKAFLAVLSITVVLTACAALFQVYRGYHRSGQKLDPNAWQEAWFEDCLSEALFCFVMITVAVIWRPRENNTRYGYAEFFTDDDDNGAKPDGGYSLDSDDTTIQLETLTVIGGGELSQRRKANAPTTTTTTTTTTSSVMSVGDVEADKNLAAVMPHLTEFEKDIITFDLSDESDEVSVQTQLKKLD